MAINKKLIYYNRTLALFKADANGLNGLTNASSGNVGNIPYASIVFTSDGYIWTHGKEFNCNNTWRGIQNNLTSTSTTDSLSAYQGKILNEKFANYLPLSGGTLTGALTVPSLTVTGASTFSQAINGSILGNSATASRLLNARTITIGSLSNSFDGSANISYSLASMGAFASSSFTLANIKSTLGISDWALASSKPSYNFSEIGAGTAVIGDGANYLLWRSNSSWVSGVYYHITGNEAVVFGNGNANTSWIFATTNPKNRADWTTLTPSMQIKNGKVAINKLIANGANLTYALEVNGDVQANNFRGNLVGNASTVTNGVYTTGDQTISGNKTFSGSTSLDDATIGNLVVTGGASFALTINGNAATASKLLTARTITIGNKSNSFDGSGNISFTLAQIGALAAGSYKTVQTAVATIGASTNTLKFINSISQDTNGVITATTGVVRDASTSVAGVVSTGTQSFAGTKTFTGQTIISTNYFGNLLVLNRGNDGGTWGPSIIFQNNGTFLKCIGVDVNGVAYVGDNGSTNYKIYHAGNLSIGTLMGSSAIGDSDEPVYWSGSAFVKAGAYPTKASWNYDDKYLPLTGANYNTNTDANPFKISRNGGNDEVLAISVNDSRTLFKYTNDEYSNLIVFELVNTDTENSNGSRASDRNVTISSSNYGISMTIGGSTVWHAGNLTTTAAASGGTTAALVTTGDKYKWNSVYDWWNVAANSDGTNDAINLWKEVEAFLTGITDTQTLTGLLASRVAKSGDTMTGALTTPGLTVTGSSTFNQAINGSILGNAATASRLQNARTISLTGSVTGSGSFDGSGNLSIATTTNHSHSLYVLLDVGLSEQTIKSSIGSLSKGVINLWRNSGDHYTFLGFSNGTTETYLGGIGFKSLSDHNLYRKDGTNYYKIFDENNYTSYINTTNFPGLNSVNTHTYTSTWTSVTGNNAYPIAISPNATPATSGNGYNANFTFNPSTKTFNNNGCRLQYDSTNKVLKFYFD